MVNIYEVAAFATFVGMCAAEPLPKHGLLARAECNFNPKSCSLKPTLKGYNSNLMLVSDILKPEPVERAVPLKFFVRVLSDYEVSKEEARAAYDEAKRVGSSQGTPLGAVTQSPRKIDPITCPSNRGCGIVWQQKMQEVIIERECGGSGDNKCVQPDAFKFNAVEVNEGGTDPRGRYFLCYDQAAEGEVACAQAVKSAKDVELSPV